MVSVDMVDGHGVNESVISATERIVIQQQSNNLKVVSIPFLTPFNLRLVLTFSFSRTTSCVFLSADPISPALLLLPTIFI
jgi:hypothetical protein